MNPAQKPIPAMPVQLALPVKVAGIVFWGMVLIGLLLSVLILQAREHELASTFYSKSKIFSSDIEHALEQGETPEDLHRRVAEVFQLAQTQVGIEAMSLVLKSETINLGQRTEEQDEYIVYVPSFHLTHLATGEDIELKVYFASLKRALTDLRKNMLMIIGSLVFLFGLILQQILQKILSKPFLGMVLSAERFAQGETNVRFDEQRSDEFGYLAKFINRALNTLMQHQQDLEVSRQALFEEKERAEVTLKSIMDGVVTLDAAGCISYLNPVAERLCGSSDADARHRELTHLVNFVHEDSAKRLLNPVDRVLQENIIVELPPHAALVRSDGSSIPIEASAAPMRDDAGQVIGAVLVLQDVSHSRRLTRQLSYQASHDALTGLYNRRMFEESLQAALINVEEENRHHALCYIDLDQFKIVNDTCGHMAGDELLRQLSILLQDCVRGGDVLARLGGDEFGVLLENCPLTRATQVADKIRQRVKDHRFAWQDKSFEIGASIGVVGISADNLDIASIMSAADVACYAAKDMGRNRVHVYEPTDAMLAERHGQMHWASRIVQALENQRMVLFQQPIFGLGAEGGEHCEILVRMIDDNGVYVPPNAFIPAAERYNLMSKVDRWVIESVFRRMSSACHVKHDKMVAINLSGNSLADDELLAFIRQAGHEYGVDFQQICFEITETAAISNLSNATRFMTELRQEGCRFALDDFGSGLSSFGYLKNLPVDYVKIDGSFVKDMSTDPIDRAMVEAITRVAHVMQIRAIAEWVEDEPTLQLLKAMGVDFAQGYYLGKPKEVGDSSLVE
jgi:diguanylate cyclase (GGDEF)-like protein/PAS domain S-box-containing protein